MSEITNNLKNDESLNEIKKRFGGNKILIDYCGPNIGKKMHLSHLRTTIIGESIKRLLKYCGNYCIGDIHYGDIGIQMGTLLAGLKNEEYNLNKQVIDIEKYFEIQKSTSILSKSDPILRVKSLEEALRIQNMHPNDIFFENIVHKILNYLKDSFLKPLNISFENFYGESRYISLIDKISETFSENVINNIDGSINIPISNELGSLYIKTKDGLITYAGIDMAAIYDRLYNQNIDQIVYVIDERQERHWRQVFSVWETKKVRHKLAYLPHGKILDKNGNPYKLDPYFGISLDNYLSLITKKIPEIIEYNFDIKDENSYKQISHSLFNLIIKFSDFQQDPAMPYIFDIESDDFFSQHFSVKIFKTYTLLKISVFFQDNKKISIKSLNNHTESLKTEIILFPSKIEIAISSLSLAPLIKHLKNLDLILTEALLDKYFLENNQDLVNSIVKHYEEIFDILAIPLPELKSYENIKINNV